MKRESLAFALSGTFFGLLVGWIIGAQHRAAAPVEPAAPTTTSAQPTPGRTLDAARVSRLEQQASAEPQNAAVRVELGNLYFDAERYDAAIPWYQAALKIDPKNVNASTDLGVAYYSLPESQPDRALAQFDESLKIDPRHLKTLLNQGIVRAFGKRDLAGAADSWERVVAIAPTSEEGLRAAQGLEGLRAAHAAAGGTTTPSTSGQTGQ
jgi:tetratricopeptide (TPR) repeat protein